MSSKNGYTYRKNTYTLEDATIFVGKVEFSNVAYEVEKALGANSKSAYSYVYSRVASGGRCLKMGGKVTYYPKRRIVKLINDWRELQAKAGKLTLSSAGLSADSKELAGLLKKLEDNPNLAKILLDLMA